MSELETFDKFFAGFLTIVLIVFGSLIALGWMQLLFSAPLRTLVFTSTFVWGFKRIYPRMLRLLNGGDPY